MSWEPLPDRDWEPTIRSLHRWSQVVGKIRLALAPAINHWWHVTLYVTPRGLTTSAIPYRGGLFDLEFDLQGHTLDLRRNGDPTASLRLGPMSVADFHRQIRQMLNDEGVDVRIRSVPVEVEDAIPFDEDTASAGYDPEHARALHGALIDADRVLSRFRGSFGGKASPVHFFWGGFDIAVTRFSGRLAPRHPGGAPNCPDWVQHEAYSHEVRSAGWWPGSGGVGPSFYAYMYPEPDGYGSASLGSAPGAYHDGFREFILSYDEVARADDPDAALLAFLEATYTAGADLAGWDRAHLERSPGLRLGVASPRPVLATRGR